MLLAVCRALDTAGIDHAAYGGLALAAYGSARETKDADVAVAGLETQAALSALQKSGIHPTLSFEDMRFGGLLITRFALLGNDGDLNVANFIRPTSKRYANAALPRSMQGTLRDQAIRVLTPEDFVLFKILSTSERDVEDAQTVWHALEDELDSDLIIDESAVLADEVPDHDVLERLKRSRPGCSHPEPVKIP